MRHFLGRAAAAAVLLALAARAGVAAADEVTVNGLYPLWEHTAALHPRAGAQVGLWNAQLGLGPVQVGTQPLLDAYQMLNAQVKVALLAGDRLRLAAVGAVYHVPRGAEGRTVGKLHAFGFANPYGSVLLVPVSLATSFVLSPRAHLHAATTALSVSGAGVPEAHVSVGQTAILELRASPRWIAAVHAGVEGLGSAAQGHGALSFTYRGDILELRGGIGRRFTADAGASTLVLFDMALLFR